jgi:hypothetical protein
MRAKRVPDSSRVDFRRAATRTLAKTATTLVDERPFWRTHDRTTVERVKFEFSG